MFDHIKSEADQLLKKVFDIGDLSVDWQRPKETSHGDLTTTIALKIARVKGVSPREVAEKIVEGMQNSPSVERAEVAGAGYVNLWLKPVTLVEELETTEKMTKPRKANKKNAPVVIDYSAPNIAKPLGIHHILSTVIGQSLTNLYRHAGVETVAINHIGDWGTQFGKLAVALQKWSTKPVSECSLDDLLALYVKFHDEAEKDESLEDEGRAAFKKIEEGDTTLRNVWEQSVRITMKELDGIYDRLHVSFDHTQGESFYEDKMKPIIDEGKKKGVFVPGKEGALIVEFPEETGLSPAVVVKGDDATIYLTRDLATARYRIDTFHPQSILYVVDVAQQYYFKQLFETLKQLGWDLPTMEHVYFGRMSFKDRKMSTRKGNILKLEHVLDEAVKRADEIIAERGDTIQTDNPKELGEMMGIGALVYGILSQNRKMDLVFDWDKMLSFEGNSAPYLQYTHARAMSVLRKADVTSATMPKKIDALTSSERILVGTLLQFGAVLDEARTEHLPHKLANYLYQLCQDFNSFYNTESILNSESSERELRLFLTSLTATVLKAGAELLTLRVPDRM